MVKFIDLTGQRFGKLIIIKRAKDRIRKDETRDVQWLCQCDCGNNKIVLGSNLKSRSTKSCGCLQQENRKLFAIKTVEWRKRPRIFEEITKICKICGKEYKTKGRDADFCKCVVNCVRKKNREGYEKNKELVKIRTRTNKLKRVFGITDEDYEQMYFEQGKKCAICGKELLGTN